MNVLECNCSWHFAKQQEASQDVGPNNAAAEHFTATPYNSPSERENAPTGNENNPNPSNGDDLPF